MSQTRGRTALGWGALALFAGVAAGRGQTAARSGDWPAYGGSVAQTHYSPLKQIDRANVQRLKVAWTFDTHEELLMQTNPLIVGDVLYAYTPSLKVIALDAATGKLLWKFDSGVDPGQPSRGLLWWTDGRTRILFADIMNFVYALDPATGKPIESFGEGGRIDLRKDLRGDDLRGDYTKHMAIATTPGVIYKDNLIVGFRAPEAKPAPPGDIRAYNVHSGKLEWSFHTIPHPGEKGYETWPKDAWKSAGAANNWMGMALDARRGIVYVPTGSAVTDFYGYDRIGDDLYANTLLALDAATGKELWHFQTTHHDMWDRDLPTAPVLLTVMHDGRRVDAVAQTTKQGYVFLFDRVTGKPLFPVKELPFPASDLPGEKASLTQPLPEAPPPFARQRLTADMLTTRTPEAHAWAEKAFAAVRSDGQYVPFTTGKETIILPGFDGGAEWGGPAVDPRTGVLFVNANEMAWLGGLTPNTAGSPGARTYGTQCALCHGEDRKGGHGSFPSLVNIGSHLSDAAITATVRHGMGRMPSFPNLDAEQMAELLRFLKSTEGAAAAAEEAQRHEGNDPEGAKIYTKRCAICHGDDRMGTPSNDPGLVGVRRRMTDAEILRNVHEGKGRMPATKGLSDAEDAALLRFLGPALKQNTAADKKELESTGDDNPPYRFTGYNKFLDPEGYPAIAPPWGTLTAIDLNTGKFVWQIPFGVYPELAEKGLTDTGTENYGGPVLTASGLLFIGATVFDHTMHAFDSRTGKLLWSAELPYTGLATPATYMAHGKQYVVIATTGQRNPKGAQGGAYVAFALP